MSQPPSSRPNLRRRRQWGVLLRRLGLTGAGALLIILGILSVPTPVPIGFVLFAVGLYLLARGSKRAKRSVKDLRRLVPPLSRSLNRLKHRLPGRLQIFIERSDPGE
ncbi:PGPGW domain-containing protein [Telmatospirillum sp.]|uniref:PGPGW domain-containing protein n=1 Tax=Telmatospirillum sp. TaxID=2079197 RepID=UPI00284E6699|nr:PGPGW domain-containing protein [Telmatospirillum sp.]MDR3441092.1 PGPGW domain-containing protein [Telmatospirillum sp.]